MSYLEKKSKPKEIKVIKLMKAQLAMKQLGITLISEMLRTFNHYIHKAYTGNEYFVNVDDIERYKEKMRMKTKEELTQRFSINVNTTGNTSEVKPASILDNAGVLPLVVLAEEIEQQEKQQQQKKQNVYILKTCITCGVPRVESEGFYIYRTGMNDSPHIYVNECMFCHRERCRVNNKVRDMKAESELTGKPLDKAEMATRRDNLFAKAVALIRLQEAKKLSPLGIDDQIQSSLRMFAANVQDLLKDKGRPKKVMSIENTSIDNVAGITELEQSKEKEIKEIKEIKSKTKLTKVQRMSKIVRDDAGRFISKAKEVFSNTPADVFIPTENYTYPDLPSKCISYNNNIDPILL